MSYEMHERAPAKPVIEDVTISPGFGSDNFKVGEEAEVEVTIRDTSSGTNTGESHNSAFVYVDSPQLDQHILMGCEIIQPGGTITRDDSSGDDIGFDGEFPITESEMEITVVAGGFVEGTTCNTFNYPDSGQNNVRETTTITAEGDTQEQPNFAIQSVSATPQEITLGDEVTVEVEVRNEGGPGAETIRYGIGEEAADELRRFTNSDPDLNNGESRLLSATFEPAPGEADLDFVGARNVTRSGPIRKSGFSVMTPEFEDAIDVGSAEFVQDSPVQPGESVNFKVPATNTSEQEWRVTGTFRQTGTGARIGTKVVNIPAGQRRVFNVEFTAPAGVGEVEICGEFTGQVV